MISIDQKILRAQCHNLLREYEPLLRQIIDQETATLNSDTSLKETQFEIAKDAIFKAGIREGMRKLVAKINELSKQHAND